MSPPPRHGTIQNANRRRTHHTTSRATTEYNTLLRDALSQISRQSLHHTTRYSILRRKIDVIPPNYCKRDFVPQYTMQILCGYLPELSTNLTMANIMAETCS